MEIKLQVALLKGFKLENYLYSYFMGKIGKKVLFSEIP